MRATLGVALFVFATVAQAAPAGDRWIRGGADVIGNGGDVLVCMPGPSVLPPGDSGTATDRPSRIELLDFYEAKVLREMEIDLGSIAVPYLDKAKMAFQRLARLDPERSDRYLKRLGEFLANARFIDAKLTDVPDSGYVPLPESSNEFCEVRQVAVQREPHFAEDRKFIVNRKLWDWMDNDSKAGLVIHEIVYEELIKHGAENSIAARYFAASLATRKFETMPREEYYRFLKTLDQATLPLSVQGMVFTVGEIELFETGELKSGTLIGSATIQCGPYRFVLNGGSRVEFFPGARPRAVELSGGLPLNIQVGDEKIELVGHRMSFHPNGAIAGLYGRGRFGTAQGKQELSSLSTYWPLRFHPNGQVKSGFTRTAGGKGIELIEFDSSGNELSRTSQPRGEAWACAQNVEEVGENFELIPSGIQVSVGFSVRELSNPFDPTQEWMTRLDRIATWVPPSDIREWQIDSDFHYYVDELKWAGWRFGRNNWLVIREARMKPNSMLHDLYLARFKAEGELREVELLCWGEWF